MREDIVFIILGGLQSIGIDVVDTPVLEGGADILLNFLFIEVMGWHYSYYKLSNFLQFLAGNTLKLLYLSQYGLDAVVGAPKLLYQKSDD